MSTDDPRLGRDVFRLYEWVKTDGRRIGRRHSDRATDDHNPAADDTEGATLDDFEVADQ